MSGQVLSRRGWLTILGTLSVASRRAVAQQQGTPAPALPRAGQGDVGQLFNPDVAGRSRAPTTLGDNDAAIRAVEQRLGCTCGCTLDIFTCRTTDFTCTYSPALHREVLALAADGKAPEQIIDAFVEKYGEKVLMAPRPQGFNVAGYVVPGILILLVGGLLAWVLRRRVARRAAVAAPAPAGEPASHDAAEIERLEQALREIDA